MTTIKELKERINKVIPGNNTISIAYDINGILIEMADVLSVLASNISVFKFIQLTDTPDTYEGQSGKVASVKQDESGLEFSTLSESGGWLYVGTLATLTGNGTIDQADKALSFINSNSFSILGNANDTKIVLSDVDKTIVFTSTNGIGINKTPSIRTPLAVGGLPSFENETLAGNGGLVSGEFYKTSTGVLMVKL